MFLQFLLLYIVLDLGIVASGNAAVNGFNLQDAFLPKNRGDKEAVNEKSSTKATTFNTGDEYSWKSIYQKFGGFGGATEADMCSKYEKKWRKITDDERIPSSTSIKIDLQTDEILVQVKEEEKVCLVKEIAYTQADIVEGLKTMKQAARKRKAEITRRMDLRDPKVILEEFAQYGFKDNSEYAFLKEFLFNYIISDMDNKLLILSKIKFVVHQYSIAEQFVRMGGVKILLRDISSLKNETLQATIAVVLSTAMQGHIVVKEAALQNDAIPSLLTLLESSGTLLKPSILFAVSSLVQQYPDAQDEFMREGGCTILSHLFLITNSSDLLNNMMIFIYDLLVENKHNEDQAEKQQNFDAIIKTRSRKMRLEKLLKQNKFCIHFVTLMSNSHDNALGTLVQTLPYLKRICKNEFKAKIPTLKLLAVDYNRKIYIEVEKEIEEKGIKAKLSKNLYFLPKYNLLSNFIEELELLPDD